MRILKALYSPCSSGQGSYEKDSYDIIGVCRARHRIRTGGAAKERSGFGLEVNAAYNFALRDLSEGSEEVPAHSVDTYGVDLTAFYAINKHHTVNIRFGYTTGNDDHAVYYEVRDYVRLM